VSIAQSWVREYGVMPEETKKLIKHYHLLAACRLMGVDRVRLDTGLTGLAAAGGGAAVASLAPTDAVLLLGPEVRAERWAGLCDQAKMSKEALDRFEVPSDGRGAVIRGLGPDKSKWIDLMLEVMLPLAAFVVQNQTMMEDAPP
jgi:hypothetical protein